MSEHIVSDESDGSLGPRAVHRALHVLTLVIDHGPSTLADLAAASELPASTTMRILRALDHWGFVHRTEANLYELGSKFMTSQIDPSLTADATLAELAYGFLTEASEYTKETVYFVIPGPAGTCVYIHEIESKQPVRFVGFDGWTGRVVPRKGSAVGAVLDRPAPEAGYVAMEAALTPEAISIAAPVLDADGTAVGALSISGPSFRVTGGIVEDYGTFLAGLAGRFSDVIRSQ